MSAPLLDVRGVSKRFGGLLAVNQVSFDVQKGDLISIIGPNGAGKTTLFNLLTGQLTPSEGQVLFDGHDIGALSPNRRAKLGLGRTFQISQTLTSLTAIENAMVGAFLHHASLRAAARRAEEVLHLVGLGDRAGVRAGILTLSERRRLEVARALALSPRIVLLDEVMAGLNPTEVGELVELVEGLNREGHTFLVIEHNLKVVRRFSHRVIVVDRGAKLAEGTADEVLQDPRVIEAYVGRQRGVMSTTLLVDKVSAGYGDAAVLFEASFSVNEGEIVAIVGANGAGKTTLLSTIVGLVPVRSGHIIFRGQDITNRAAHLLPGSGLALVPEGGRLFPFMTVEENLMLGAYTPASRARLPARLKEMMDIFPILRERRLQEAGKLSGGERQMCAIARALMCYPSLLMLDEPSVGLSPLMVGRVFEITEQLARRDGLTVVIVEQNVTEALEVADRAYILDHGHTVREGPAAVLRQDREIQATYMGL